MHFYLKKRVFSWRAKKLQICCIITWKSRFSHDATENKVCIWCITFRSRFSHYAPKTLIFDALLRGKAGFFMVRQKGAHLLHYYVKKQAFSWRPKNSYIWCINTWKSRISRDATENKVYISCIFTIRSRFSHDAQKNSYIWCIITWKSRFSHDGP